MHGVREPWSELQKTDHIENDRKLQIGQTIMIPTGSSPSTASSPGWGMMALAAFQVGVMIIARKFGLLRAKALWRRRVQPPTRLVRLRLFRSTIFRRALAP